MARYVVGVLASSVVSGTVSAGAVRLPRRARHRSAVGDCVAPA